MGPGKEELPTLAEIKELLSYLPKLYAEGFSPIKRWGNGWPEYDPVVTAFFHILARNCWSDFDYKPDAAWEMVSDEAFIRTANLAQIKTMLTLCTRSERFGDGAWETAIKEGYIRRLLKRLDDIRAEIEG